MRTKYKHTSADGTVLILTTYNYTDRRKIEFWCHLYTNIHKSKQLTFFNRKILKKEIKLRNILLVLLL